MVLIFVGHAPCRRKLKRRIIRRRHESVVAAPGSSPRSSRSSWRRPSRARWLSSILGTLLIHWFALGMVPSHARAPAADRRLSSLISLCARTTGVSSVTSPEFQAAALGSLPTGVPCRRSTRSIMRVPRCAASSPSAYARTRLQPGGRLQELLQDTRGRELQARFPVPRSHWQSLVASVASEALRHNDGLAPVGRAAFSATQLRAGR
jgi:hypothetical protein